MTARPAALLLTQRIPYPPLKGEKIRAWRILLHLARTHDVHLGCLIDDPLDRPHAATVAAACAGSHFALLDRRVAKIACLRGLLTGEPLSVTFYRDRRLAAWVRRTLRDVRPAAVVVVSSNMAPYVLGRTGAARVVVDLVDVDSAKWGAYADAETGPMRLVHRREQARMASLEGRIVRECDFSVFVSAEEAALFERLQPGFSAKVRAISNGVDAAYFDPGPLRENPFGPGGPDFVFTGTMDYPPNVDAVAWFASDILPLIRAQAAGARFHVVGASPSPRVAALAGDGVQVTGRVADVRPFVAHAAACVAPMRIARGIQNKVLEAMAMARPVVVTPDALEGIDAAPGAEVLLADGAAAFAMACLVAASPAGAAIGVAARERVLRDYVWDERLRAFDALLEPA